EDDNADSLLAFELVDHSTRPPVNIRLVRVQLAEGDVDGSGVLFGRQPEKRIKRLEELLPQEFRVGEIDQRIEIHEAPLGEDVVLLRERGFHGVGRDGHRRTRVRSLQVDKRRVQLVDHRKEDRVELLLGMLREQQVVNVRNSYLRREAWIDRAS